MSAAEAPPHRHPSSPVNCHNEFERDEVMPDGSDSEHGGQAAFPFDGSQTPALLQDIRRSLSRALRLMLVSQLDQALTALETLERQLQAPSRANPPVRISLRSVVRLHPR